MKTLNHTGKTVVRTQCLVARLKAEGYVEGYPASLPEHARLTDVRSVKRMRCHSCRRQGLVYLPFTQGTGSAARYTVVAACQECHAAEIF